MSCPGVWILSFGERGVLSHVVWFNFHAVAEEESTAIARKHLHKYLSKTQ